MLLPRCTASAAGAVLLRRRCGPRACATAGGTERVVPASGAEAVAEAAAALRVGGVVALPTDTLYGLACCARDAEAIRKVYDIKRRALKQPLAVAVADPADVARVAHAVHLPPGLLDALLPGPLTVLLRRGDALSAALNPGVESVGVRVPDAAFVRDVCRAHGSAVALTSANVSAQRSPLAAEEFRHLWPALAAVFDGGRIEGASRKGSTIVDLTAPGAFRVVREGDRCDEYVDALRGRFGLRDASGDDAAATSAASP